MRASPQPTPRFKYTQQATASLSFDMCSTNTFTVNVTDVSPLPVNVSLDGAPVGVLLRPLIKVWGGKTAALDGTPSDAAYDAAVERSLETWISKFLPLPASYGGEALSFAVGDALQEGYYNVSATVSLISDYPRLINLTGARRRAPMRLGACNLSCSHVPGTNSHTHTRT